jgi:hypothetical protein
MGGGRFDDLVRLFGRGRQSRRRLVGESVATVLWTLKSVASGAQAQDCKGAGRPCTRPRQCCSGICRRRKCRCASGENKCGRTCCPASRGCGDAAAGTCCPGPGTLPGGAVCEDNEDCCSTTSVSGGAFEGPCTCCSPGHTGSQAPGQLCGTTADCCFGTCRGRACSCARGATACNSAADFTRCDLDQLCYCMTTTADQTVCALFESGVDRCAYPPCTRNRDCPTGSVCVDDPCCSSQVCETLCQQSDS